MVSVTLRSPDGRSVGFGVSGPIVVVGRDPTLGLTSTGGIYIDDSHVSRLHLVVDLFHRVISCRSKSAGVEVTHPASDGSTQRTVLFPVTADVSDMPSTYTVPADMATVTIKIPSPQGYHLLLCFGAPSPTTTGLTEAFAALKRTHDLVVSRMRQAHEHDLQTEQANHARECASVHEAKRQCIAQRDCLQADLATMETERVAMQSTMERLVHRAETSERRVASSVTMLQNVLATLSPPSPRSDEDIMEEFGQAQTELTVDSDATEEEDVPAATQRETD